MECKLNEYFAAGTQLVWYFDLKARTVTVYTAPDQSTVLDESETLDGGNVLPGLVIPSESYSNGPADAAGREPTAGGLRSL